MRIVTISRLVGSYADVIAATVARRMGLELVGRDQVHNMAQSCDSEYSRACSLYETEHGPGFFERIFFDRPSYTSLFESLTYEKASQGDVIIVGRGAQVILKDIPGVFSCRVVAPFSIRVERVMERYRFDRDEAEDFVRKYDHERESLIRSIFRSDPNEWSLYDVIINTAHYSSGDASDVVIEAIEKIQKSYDDDKLKEKLKNMSIAKRIETTIRRKLSSSVARNLEIKMERGGVVTISGKIGDRRDRDKAEKIAGQYPGVTQVINELKVTEIAFGF
ncbi:MAG: cytidylate kinase family protein [Deltaproteobacteria bacterium]|nr:cytidylate kinase family protein [Deltaproteobacteria bacterium]